MRTFLLGCLLVFSTVGVIAAELAISPAMNAELEAIEGYIKESKDNYKVDEVFPTSKLVAMKNWPLPAQRSIYAQLWRTYTTPRLVDPVDLGKFYRGVGADISLAGVLIRSLEIDIGAEKTYLAIYDVWRGGLGPNSPHFLEYYFLDARGDLLKSGYSLD